MAKTLEVVELYLDSNELGYFVSALCQTERETLVWRYHTNGWRYMNKRTGEGLVAKVRHSPIIDPKRWQTTPRPVKLTLVDDTDIAS